MTFKNRFVGGSHNSGLPPSLKGLKDRFAPKTVPAVGNTVTLPSGRTISDHEIVALLKADLAKDSEDRLSHKHRNALDGVRKQLSEKGSLTTDQLNFLNVLVQKTEGKSLEDERDPIELKERRAKVTAVLKLRKYLRSGKKEFGPSLYDHAKHLYSDLVIASVSLEITSILQRYGVTQDAIDTFIADCVIADALYLVSVILRENISCGILLYVPLVDFVS